MEPAINHIINARHRIIRCCYDPHLDISYIHIPKCGSTAVRQAIENSSGIDYFTFKVKHGLVEADENLFTIIRNPLDRWISGFLQYAHNTGDLPYQRAKSGDLIYDEHTLPMSEFLRNFDTDIKYFKLSTNVITEINSYYEMDLKSRIVNVTPKPPEIVTALNKIIETNRFQVHFNRIYAEDIKLWKSLDLCV